MSIMKSQVSENGFAMIVALFLMSVVFSAVSVSYCLLKHVGDEHNRYLITQERIKSLKNAMIGNFSGGNDDLVGIGNSFFNDYGEPDCEAELLKILLEKDNSSVPLKTWKFNDNDGRIWCGYRGTEYIHSTLYNGECKYLDGWNNEIEAVIFDNDGLCIRSLGSDGQENGDDKYAQDILTRLVWRRSVKLTVYFTGNTSAYSAGDSVEVYIYFSAKGEVSNGYSYGTLSFYNANTYVVMFPSIDKIAVGARKAVFSINGQIVAEKLIYVDEYELEPDEEITSVPACVVKLRVFL